MFRKILVCVDGSPRAMAAARVGAAVARHYGAEIIALNVFHHQLAGPAAISSWAIEIEQSEIDRCARQEKASIEHMVCPIFSDLDTPVRIVQEIGHPVEAILALAEREEVDLIVVGSRGLQGIKELFLGSVSSALLHHAKCPVLIVRGDNFRARAGDFQEIVLASDGSVRAQKAAEVAVDMAQKFATSLTVLNVCADVSTIMLPLEQAAICEEEGLLGEPIADLHSRRMLELVREKVGAVAHQAGVYCSYIQRTGHPYDAIMHYAETQYPDLIVLGSHGMGGFGQMLVGSVSNFVAHHAPCPVLVVR